MNTEQSSLQEELMLIIPAMDAEGLAVDACAVSLYHKLGVPGYYALV